MSESKAIGFIESLSNWGRWGPDDQLGTLNFVDASCRQAAAALVREGVSISCSWDVAELQRFMKRTGEGLSDPHRAVPAKRAVFASEHVGLQFHSRTMTHVDAPSHVFWDGFAYNGVPGAHVSAELGATSLAITAWTAPLVTRGVLIDLPRALDVERLPPGRAILPAELDAAESRQGVRVRQGDALLVRTGHGALRLANGVAAAVADGHPGFDPACMPWFHRRSIALLGSDTTNDVEPLGEHELNTPVHVIGLRAMGLSLLDNANLEALSEACDRLGRQEFMFVVAPLRLVGATGSPVDPVAVL